jgi:ribosomal protein L30E
MRIQLRCNKIAFYTWQTTSQQIGVLTGGRHDVSGRHADFPILNLLKYIMKRGDFFSKFTMRIQLTCKKIAFYTWQTTSLQIGVLTGGRHDVSGRHADFPILNLLKYIMKRGDFFSKFTMRIQLRCNKIAFYTWQTTSLQIGDLIRKVFFHLWHCIIHLFPNL